MYIFNVYNDSSIRDIVVEYLKSKGVKYKPSKKPKDISANRIATGVFQTPLQSLPKVGVTLKEGKAMIEVPKFLADICSTIEQNINVEGIFRKGGSASKQRDLKQLINSGMPLPEECHVVDACNLVKLFLRELPEPLIPFSFHETLLSCLILSGEEAQREALLLSCLLIYREHLNVLAFVLEFLSKVALHSLSNKMDEKNLAIVLTPSLMPIDAKTKLRSNFNISHHISVIELLIKCADEIGEVPKPLADQAVARRGRKRRSGSITRMFTGIRKMVGRGPSPPRVVSPPKECGAQKRKSLEILPPAVTVKRRREMADTTPRMCRMGGYSGASMRRKSEEVAASSCVDVSPDIGQNKEEFVATRPTARKGGRKQMSGLKTSKSTSSLLMSKKKSLERKLSSIAWGKRRSSAKLETTPEADNVEQNKEQAVRDVVTIPRKEYEDMVIRVTCMEKLLQDQCEDDGGVMKSDIDSENLAEQLGNGLRIRWSTEMRQTPVLNSEQNTATAVQAAFERTVEQAEQLAPQLRKDVRLRWSSEHRVARSPSERKIGSIRRRSRELARSNSADAKTSLQRGRPNTRQTGLRSPRERSDPHRVARPNASDPKDEQWKPASAVLASPSLANRLRGSPRKRDSINCLRRNNLGMVHAKAKFFDSLNHSTDAESERSNQSMEQRLQSVQAELQRQPRTLKENRQPAIKAPLGAPATVSQLKTPRSVARPVSRPRATPLKALPDVNTPQRGVRRSPRILSRAMSLHTSASTRTP